MENALWNGELIMASEVAKQYEVEKRIRIASSRKELRCLESNCSDPIIRYCHGDKKSAYFAHINNVNCDYSKFEKSDTQILRNIRRKTYEHFLNEGYNVKTEAKVLPHHYSHFIFDLGDKKIAVELGTKRTSVGQVEKLNEEYKRAGISVNWVVVDDTDKYVIEDQTFFLNRYSFNETKSKSLIVINGDGNKVAQYKRDNSDYQFENSTIATGFGDTYKEESNIDELVFDGGEIAIRGFNEKYNKWVRKKREVFEQKVKRIIEDRKIQIEANKIYKKLPLYRFENKQRLKPSNIEASSDFEHQKLKEEILPFMNQQTKQVRDSKDNRWIKCEKCGLIDTDSVFSSYGGEGRINLGVCNNCSRQYDKNRRR